MGGGSPPWQAEQIEAPAKHRDALNDIIDADTASSAVRCPHGLPTKTASVIADNDGDLCSMPSCCDPDTTCGGTLAHPMNNGIFNKWLEQELGNHNIFTRWIAVHFYRETFREAHLL